jgi:C_GCAxxG_C_C family probable redox protein
MARCSGTWNCQRVEEKLTDLAEARLRDGYSCSQAVFSVLAERWNVSPEVSLRIAAGFGGGLARSAQTCGCVTGAVMAIGLAQSEIDPERNRSEKERTCERSRRFMRAFEERSGSTLCSELLGCDISTPEGMERARLEGLFQSRCTNLVRNAVEMVQDMFAEPSVPAQSQAK